jgi:general secretion pathway protein K
MSAVMKTRALMRVRRRHVGSPPQRQRGIAMLVAILLVALGTILAAAVAYESAMSARRGTATISFDEALLVGQGAEALAAYGLKTVLDNPSKPGQGGGASSSDVFPAQPWAQPVGPIEVVPGVTLEASLEDLQGRFNLNWLVSAGGPGNPNNGQNPNPTGTGTPTGLGGNTINPGGLQGPGPDEGAVRAFNKLLEEVGVSVDPKWADQLVDWIDSDNLPQSQGAEDSAYLGQNPPYLAANRYITSASELLALGFSAEDYRKLAPYITALPPATPFNICTASAVVLDALSSEKLWTNDPSGLDKNRETAGACFPDKNTYTQQLDPEVKKSLGGKIGTTSSFFRLSSLITIGTTEFNLYSLLYVDAQGHYAHPIQRSFSPD